RVDGRARDGLPERRPRPRADDPHVRRRRGQDPPLGRRPDRLGLRPRGGGRGVVGEGAAAPAGDRRPAARAGRALTLLALAVGGRGVVDPDEPVVFADDEGFLRGRAAFETTRVYGGRPFRLDRHLERLAGSAARLGLPAPDLGALERLALEAVAAAGERECSLRIYFTPGREGNGRPGALALVQALPPWLD